MEVGLARMKSPPERNFLPGQVEIADGSQWFRLQAKPTDKPVDSGNLQCRFNAMLFIEKNPTMEIVVSDLKYKYYFICTASEFVSGALYFRFMCKVC